MSVCMYVEGEASSNETRKKRVESRGVSPPFMGRRRKATLLRRSLETPEKNEPVTSGSSHKRRLVHVFLSFPFFFFFSPLWHPVERLIRAC